jgi:hypothetical protein
MLSRNRSSAVLWGVILILTMIALPAFAQEYRATVLGTITDPSGAVVPNAKVALVNADTAVQSAAESNSQGLYNLSYVLPGRYTISVEMTGFKKYVRGPFDLKTSERLRMDVALEVGTSTESVVVNSAAPLLETASADRGEVVGNESLNELPIQSGNPYTLMNLSTGVQYTGSMLYYRPFDNGAINSFTINGGQNSTNEFQMDGTPNVAAGTGNVAYVPPAEATQEFKVQTNTYDAQYGRTGGGIVNVSAKSGTNNLHGAVYWNLRREDLYANTYIRNFGGMSRLSPQSVDQYGFEVEGPVFLPKFYNGKKRTFFMVAWEKFNDKSPRGSGGSTSVPTDLERTGDFSNSLTSSGTVTPIYDPESTTANPSFDPTQSVSASNPQYIRTAFSNNKIPTDRMSQIALKLLESIPTANQTGDANTQANNFLGKNLLEVNHFYNVIARVDHSFNDNWRIYGRWDRNFRKITNPSGVNGWNTPASTADFWTARINDGGAFDVTGALSPTTTLNVRLGYTRYNTFVKYTSEFDQSTLGFPSTLLAELPLSNHFPALSLDGYTGSSNPGDNLSNPSNTYSLQGSLTKIAGRHSFKFGGEYRLLQYGYVPGDSAGGPPGSGSADQAGSYGFTRTETAAYPEVNDGGSTGNSVASMMLGVMNSAGAAILPSFMYSWHVPALFVHDDWQLNSRLSVNMGLRWDYESPVVERNNAQVRGFDFSTPSSVQIDGYVLRGGLLYAGVGETPKGEFDPDWNNVQPRFGLSYRVFKNHPLVFRGGYGMYYAPTNDLGQTTGYSATTSATTMTAAYKPAVSLSNPFPNGLKQPVKSTEGLATELGDSISFNNPTRTIPRMHQYSAGFEYELSSGLLIEATYVGSRTSQLQTGKDISHLTVEQLEMGTSYLSTVVANPFYGKLPATSSLGSQSMIQRRQLLVPYPQYNGVSMNTNSIGSSWYNSGQVRVEKRLKNGLNLLVSYTRSKTMGKTQYMNAQDSDLYRSISSQDIPQRLVVSGTYRLPFGTGRKWLAEGVGGKVLGGWQFSWNFTAQNGAPLGWSSGYYLEGNPKLAHGQTIDKWFNTSSSIWVAQPSDTLRTTPFYSTAIRNYMRPQVDINVQREITIKERHNIDFRVAAFNATNTPILGGGGGPSGGIDTNPSSPTFGQVSKSMANLPRELEIDLKYRF